MKNNKPDISLIRKYLNGELDAAAMYQLERQAQDDPLLMDMMQGMEEGDRERDERNLQDIDELIRRRVQKDDPKTARITNWKGWAVAASLVLVSTIAGMWFFRAPQQGTLQQRVTQQQEKLQQETLQKQETEQLSKIRQRPAEKEVNEQDSVSRDHTVLDRMPQPEALSVKINVDAAGAKGARPRKIVEGSISSAQESVIKGIPDSALKGDLAKLERLGDADLNKVAVVGYGAQKKAMGPPCASAMVKPDSFPHALEGKIAGISVDATIDSMNAYKGGLSEVVVVARGVAKNRASQPVVKPVILGKAHPSIGWDAYHQYLEENASVPDGSKGTVTVAFMIGANGAPGHVMVVKSLNESADRKALTLIRNGAKWIGDPEELEKIITLKIRFR